MRAEKYVVSTTVQGITRSKIWDPVKPIPVDIQAKWVLERSGEIVRVRQSKGTASYDVGPNGVDLPQDLKLRVVPASTVLPAYKLPEGLDPEADTKTLQLLAFSGVGRGILNAQPILGAYVAYVRKQPVFTLYQKENGYQIKPLLDGVKFRLKKQAPIPGPIGEEWNITAEQLYGASIIRGSHWWRFNLVPTSVHLEDGPDEEALIEGESHTLNKVLKGLMAMFVAFSIAVYFLPRPVKIVEEVKEDPIVKFIAPPKEKIEEKIPAPVTIEVTKPEVPVVKVPPKPEPVPPKPVPVIKEKTPEKIKKSAHEKPKVATPAAEPKAATPTIDPKVVAQAAATEKLKMLRAALGGATHLIQTPTGKAAAAAKTSGIFTTSGSSVTPTEIKPSYEADTTKVGVVGGGYTKGEHATVGGKGSSFVSVDVGGPTVEEGLTKEEVGKVVHAHTGEIRYCHETALLYRPNLEGKLVVQFGINPAGVVEKATVQSSTLPDKTLEDCLMKRLMAWKFPHPKGGVHVNVSYPFLFKTLGGE